MRRIHLIPAAISAVLIMIMFAPMSFADSNYVINQDFNRVDSSIVIHVIDVNVTDYPMGNIFPGPGKVEWAHVLFTYQNIGNITATGHIQYELLDANGNTYTSDDPIEDVLAPGHTSGERFTETSIPAGATLTQLHLFEGTNPAFHTKDQYYSLTGTPTPTYVPTRDTATPTPVQESTATPTPTADPFHPTTPGIGMFLTIGAFVVVGVLVLKKSK